MIPPGTPLAPRNTEANHDVKPWDDLTDREKELFARHMEVYAGMVDNIDQNVGRLLGALDAARRARQHDLPLHLRQRRLARGRGGRHQLVLRAPAAGRRRRRRPRPPRPARRPADHAALPAGLGHGVEHAVPALQDQHPRRRPHRAVHRVVARRGSRGRRAVGRRRSSGASTATSPTCCRRCCDLLGIDPPVERDGTPLLPRAGASFAPTLADADAPSRHTADGRGDERPPRLLRGRVGDRHAAPAADPVRRRRVGALRPHHRPDRARRPLGRRARAAPADDRRLGARGVGQPDLPARRGQLDQVPDPPRAQRGLPRAGHHRGRHADARAVAVGAADLVPLGDDHRVDRLPPRRPGVPRGPRRPGRRATRSTCSTTSSGSCTTTAGARCARRPEARSPPAPRR